MANSLKSGQITQQLLDDNSKSYNQSRGFDTSINNRESLYEEPKLPDENSDEPDLGLLRYYKRSPLETFTDEQISATYNSKREFPVKNDDSTKFWQHPFNE